MAKKASKCDLYACMFCLKCLLSARGYCSETSSVRGSKPTGRPLFLALAGKMQSASTPVVANVVGMMIAARLGCPDAWRGSCNRKVTSRLAVLTQNLAVAGSLVDRRASPVASCFEQIEFRSAR